MKRMVPGYRPCRIAEEQSASRPLCLWTQALSPEWACLASNVHQRGSGDSKEVGRQARCILAQPGQRKNPATREEAGAPQITERHGEGLDSLAAEPRSPAPKTWVIRAEYRGGNWPNARNPAGGADGVWVGSIGGIAAKLAMGQRGSGGCAVHPREPFSRAAVAKGSGPWKQQRPPTSWRPLPGVGIWSLRNELGNHAGLAKLVVLNIKPMHT